MIHDDAAEQFDRYLDRLADNPRRGFAPNGFISELIRAAEAVHARDAADPSADPRPRFLAHLEDQLDMNASGVIAHVPAGSISARADGGERHSFGGRPVQTIVRPLRHPAVSAVAMAAVLVVTLVGVYLSLFAPRGEGPSVPAVAPSASPEAGPSEGLSCESTDPYFGCAYNSLHLVGNMIVQPQFLDLDAAARDARQAQLQGWAVAPGKTLAGIVGDAAAQGVVVDFVLSGVYVATFTVPVVVSPGGYTNDPIQYLAAGETVELGRGDAVTYRLGGLNEIRNPLSVQRLEFKRAVFSEDDITAYSATSEGVSTRVEGDATLPEGIGSAESGMSVALWYIQVRPPGFPPSQWADGTIVGPVDPQRGPEGTEGFVLVIGPSMG